MDQVINGIHFEMTEEGVLSFEGNGTIPGFETDQTDRPWDSEKINKLVFSDGITEIGVRAFTLCSNLKSIHIPNSVKTIAAGAFSLCKSLEHVIIPRGVRSIGLGAFAKCENLQSVMIMGDDVETSKYAFYKCKMLKSIFLSEMAEIFINKDFLLEEAHDPIPLENAPCDLLLEAGSEIRLLEQELFETKKARESLLREGDIVEFGHFCEGENKIKRPILWIVLEKNDEEVLLISKYVLLNKKHSTFKNWGVDDLYKYLNTDFAMEFFSLEERNRLIAREIITKDYDRKAEEAGEDKEVVSFEKVSLLDLAEVQRFFPTAKERIVYDTKKQKSSWWLRAFSPEHAGVIRSEDGMYESSVYTKEMGVRPVIRIKREAIDKKINGDSVGTIRFELTEEGNLIFNGIGTIPGHGFGTRGSCFYVKPWMDESKVTSITISEGIEEIGDSAFAGFENLEKITLPSSLSVIGGNAFDNCKKLKEVEYSEGLQIIKSYAFYKCPSLISVKLPDSVESIETHAFAECLNLKEIVFTENSKIQKIEEKALLDTNVQVIKLPEHTECKRLIRAEKKTMKELAGNFMGDLFAGKFQKKQTNLEEELFIIHYKKEEEHPEQVPVTETVSEALVIENKLATEEKPDKGVVKTGIIGGYCVDDQSDQEGIQYKAADTVTWTLYNDGSLVFKGNGPIPGYSAPGVLFPAVPWDTRLVKTMIFEEGITGLSLHIIKNVSPDKIVFPLSLIKSDAFYAFYGRFRSDVLQHVGTLVLPEGMTDTGRLGFYKLQADEVVFPSTLERMSCSFIEATIKRLVIPDSVTSITAKFDHLPMLEEVVIGNGIETLTEKMFEECPMLRNVTIGSGVKTIGNSCFAKCEKLGKVTVLGECLKTIGDRAFFGCKLFTYLIFEKNRIKDHSSVKFPRTLTSIGEGAFCAETTGTLSTKARCCFTQVKVYIGTKYVKNKGMFDSGLNTFGNSCKIDIYG